MADESRGHPLDDDFEFGEAESPGDQRHRPYQPLFSRSLVIAFVAFLVVFLASIASNSAPPRSELQTAAQWIYNAASAVLLVACCAILVAYAIPRFDLVRTQQRLSSLRAGTKSTFPFLLTTNAIGVVSLWGISTLVTMLEDPSMATALGLVMWILMCFAACLGVTIAVWSQGQIRAYMIGFVTFLMMSQNSSMGMWVMLQGISNRPMMALGVGYAIMISLSAMAGLLCAGAVAIVERRKDVSA